MLLFRRAQIVFIDILYRLFTRGENKAQRLQIACQRVRRDRQQLAPRGGLGFKIRVSATNPSGEFRYPAPASAL
jgi:hypothetical protein